MNWESNPSRPALRRAIRHRAREFDRPCRIFAEDFLAAESRIDLLAVGEEGEIVSIRIGIGDDDALLLTRSLSDLAWLRDRQGDLRKLAPDLGIEASAQPRAVLVCSEFAPETSGAVESVRDGALTLLRYRAYREQGHLSVLLEDQPTRGRAAAAPSAHRSPPGPTLDPILDATLDPTSDSPRDSGRIADRPGSDAEIPTAEGVRSSFAAPQSPAERSERERPSPAAPRAVAAGSSRAGFRTGLTDAQLRIDPALPPDGD